MAGTVEVHDGRLTTAETQRIGEARSGNAKQGKGEAWAGNTLISKDKQWRGRALNGEGVART